MSYTELPFFFAFTLNTTGRIVLKIFYFGMALQPNPGHGLLLLDEVSRSHTTTHHSR